MTIKDECRKVERVDVQILQRLAKQLGTACHKCKSTNLESKTGTFGNYLKCRKCGANTSWQRIRNRIGNP